MYSSSSQFASQREEAIRFVTTIGVVCKIIALNLSWTDDEDQEALLSPIRNWEQWISRSWEGWIIQFIRLVCGCLNDTIAPNNLIRETTRLRETAAETPLVAVGGDSYLFDSLADMTTEFERFVITSPKTDDQKRFWALQVLRALILVLGDGINFAYIEGAFRLSEEREEETEEPQTLLDAFEAAQPPGINSEDEHESEDDESEDDDDDDEFILRYAGGDEEEEESVPFFFFPSRRGGMNNPERNAAKDVPIVPHRREFTGHCNVQTVHLFTTKLIVDQRRQLLRSGR